jgi:G3E family GTPase
MSDIIRVYLITGVLGSGKTTFLNRIIDRFPKDKKLMILMNEFGEIGIDGTLVEGDAIDMMEISKGSIFCVCVKTDFIKGLYELSTGVRPDVLLIESTGVANPSDLKKDLQLPIFNNRFHFQEQFCLIDAAHFLDAYEAYASLEKQIASSTVFLINKTDLAAPETIEKVKGVIREFHPDPLFFETTYGDIPLENFLLAGKEKAKTPSGTTVPALSPDQLEKFIDDLIDSPDLELTPPDQLMSVTWRWEGEDLEEVKEMAKNLPSSVVRAKGFIEQGGEIYLFSYVMGDWSLERTTVRKDRIQHKNVVVYIGSPQSVTSIEKSIRGDRWVNLGVYQPFSQEKD